MEANNHLGWKNPFQPLFFTGFLSSGICLKSHGQGGAFWCFGLVFSDAQKAIKQLQETKSNAGQVLKIQIYKQARELRTHGGEVIDGWIPNHSGI